MKHEQGLYTAIVAGFLIAVLGGSRVQIGSSNGAFIVIVYDIVQRHGYDGLMIARLEIPLVGQGRRGHSSLKRLALNRFIRGFRVCFFPVFDLPIC